MKRITVLGNNSGRNAGDAAILGNLLADISNEFSNVEFKVTTTNPGFINKHFGQYNLKAVGMLPWNGCVKNFGLPLFRSMLNTDLILICDNILFDRKFYNPTFNNLSSIALMTPFCKKRNIPIVHYNCSVGPIDFPYGKKALQKVMDASALVITRDQQTKELFDNLGITYPELTIHADCALNTTPPDDSRVEEIIRNEELLRNPNGTVGFNVNAYIDNWSMTGTLTREAFSKTIAGAVDKVIEQLDVDIVFFVTQIMDLKNTNDCIRYVKNQQRVKVISNAQYTYEEITALLGRVELHAGLRTHTLIFAAAMHTPMIGVLSYPKSNGFLRTIDQDKWVVPFERFSPDSLYEMVRQAWDQREQTRAELKPIVEEEKRKARASAKLLVPYLTN